jgi:hypothetical protein
MLMPDVDDGSECGIHAHAAAAWHIYTKLLIDIAPVTVPAPLTGCRADPHWRSLKCLVYC